MVGWLITEKFAETKDGQLMEFTTFEDLTGLYDATFFPSTFQKYGHVLTGGKPYILEGLVEEDLGECTLTVKKLANVWGESLDLIFLFRHRPLRLVLQRLAQLSHKQFDLP